MTVRELLDKLSEIEPDAVVAFYTKDGLLGLLVAGSGPTTQFTPTGQNPADET